LKIHVALGASRSLCTLTRSSSRFLQERAPDEPVPEYVHVRYDTGRGPLMMTG
jgi:hypothetical protein